MEGLVNPGKRQNNALLATCSYWFGNQNFWERYLQEVVIKVVEKEASDLSSEVYDFLYKPTYYYANQGIPVGNVAFLLERTLSEFIRREKDLKSIFFPVDEARLLKCCLFEFERKTILNNRQYIDALDSSGNEIELREYFAQLSPWAAREWVKSFEKIGREQVYRTEQTDY